MEVSRQCFCIGPQNGQPLCPCQMRSVTVENGRYVRKQDLGAVPGPHEAALHKKWLDVLRDLPEAPGDHSKPDYTA